MNPFTKCTPSFGLTYRRSFDRTALDLPQPNLHSYLRRLHPPDRRGVDGFSLPPLPPSLCPQSGLASLAS